MWFGSTRDVSVIKTTLSHITNMFTGVTKGFLYKMRFAYAHFPVGVTVEDNKIEIRNFLGEKRMRVVALPEGVKVCLHCALRCHRDHHPLTHRHRARRRR